MRNRKAKEKSRKPKDGYCILLPFYFLILNVVFMLVSGCASTSSREKEVLERIAKSGRSIVSSIEFLDNRAFKDKTLREKLDFKAGDYLDPILAETGRAAVAEFYRQKGFPDVRVALDSNSLPQGKVIYTVDEGPRIKIRSVRFKGNKAIKTSDLKKVIKLQTREWLFWSSYYTEEKVAADVERLRSIYYERGFLNHSVRAEGQSDITFIIEEGPIYKIGKIIITGNKHFDLPAIERLQKGLKLEPGRTYNQRGVNSYAAAILKLYSENGFIDADVEHYVLFVEAGTQTSTVGVVDVEFSITEGNQFRIGQVEISGNEVTQDRVIRRILDEYDFTPGQLYNADIAPKEGGGRLERDVQRMLLTEQTTIRPASPADGATDRKDARVDIKEGLTGMWSPGVAVSSDAGMIGRLVFQQRNFDITDWPESFGEFITMKAFRGAGQTFRMSLEPGTQVSQYSVAFTEPYFRDKPISMDVVVSSYMRGRESYLEERLRSYLGFEQRLKNRWRRSIGFRLENVDVTNIDFGAPEEIRDVAGNNLLAGVRVGIGRDMVDDRFNPSRGYSFDTGYEQVTGDENFGILKGSYAWYRTLYEDLIRRKTVLAAKLQAATVVGDAPPFEKFYAGGTSTYGIRGFRYRGVSTRGGVGNDPIGSDWIILASSEVTVPLIGENFSALFFMDSGTIDTGGYRASAGAGIQILIPQWFGPVPMRFELATPLKKNGQDETQAFSFSVGGLF